MNDKAGFLVSIPSDMLVRIIKNATDTHCKINVSLGYLNWQSFTVLELAQELSERFPLSNEEVAS